MGMKHLWLMVSLAAVPACGTEKNPALCCNDAADCASVGLTEASECSDGLLCRGNQCVAESCTTSSECEGGAPYCSSSNLCQVACDSDSQCPGFGDDARLMFCEMGSCVECRSNTDCSDADTPVCNSSGTCVGCASDSDCTSGLCGLHGVCVDPMKIVYLDPAGTDSGNCTQQAPCKTVAYGFDQIHDDDRNKLSMKQGTYNESPYWYQQAATQLEWHGHGSTVNVTYGDNYLYQFDTSISIRDLVIHATQSGGRVLSLRSPGAIYSLDNVSTQGAAGIDFGGNLDCTQHRYRWWRILC